MKNYLRTLRGLKREARLYLIADALSGFTVDGGVYAVLFNLYLLRLGYQSEFIGAVNAAGLLAYGLFSLPAGWLGARWGSRRMIGAGLGAMAIGGFAIPLAEFVPPDLGAVWLIAAYVFTYSGLALHITNATPFLVEITGEAERPHLFSVVSASWFLAGFAGNLIGGVLPWLFASSFASPLASGAEGLDQPAPYRYSLWLAALLLIPASLAMRAARRGAVRREAEPVLQSFQPQTGVSAQIGLLALVRFLLVMGVGAVLIFFNMYLEEGLGHGTAGIGMLLGAGRLCAAVTALLLPMLAARWSNARLVVATATGMTLSMAPLILLPIRSAAAFSFICVIALMAIRIPTFLVYAMESVAPTRRPLMSGAGEMANGLGFAFIGLGGGYVISAMGYRPLFLLSACLTAAGTFVFFRLSSAKTPRCYQPLRHA